VEVRNFLQAGYRLLEWTLMHVEIKRPTKTSAVLTVTADKNELEDVRRDVLQKLGKDVKVAGFRPGKAPAEMVEKQLNQQLYQQEFVEEAVQRLYPNAAKEQNLRPIDRPDISLKSFVPFNDLTFEAKVDVLGEVKLPDYKKIKMERKTAKVTKKDIEEVIENLRTQSAEKKSVKRAAKNGDQVMIDFNGKDKDGKAIKGADGKDYPLMLGSNTFIPGFEENLVGKKPEEETTFDVTFPKDYGVSSLAGEKVTFTVTIKDVKEVVKPELDDTFAKSVGPVESVDQLRSDIEKELKTEKQRQADTAFESELVRKITKDTKMDVPQALIDDQVERMMQELKQNLTYRGQTIQEFLEAKGVSEEEYKKQELAKEAEERVKASIVLSEIAEKENIQITPEELEIRLQMLKGQYKDPQMQEELNKPESRHNIASRMLSEKTVAQLAAFAAKS
jgi:trigger factor